MRWLWLAALTLSVACLPKVGSSNALVPACDRRLPDKKTTADLPYRSVTVKGSDARCNDGSPPRMYVKAGDEEHARDWVITFEGGGFCADYQTCVTRWCGIGPYDATRMSTRFDAPSINPGGILASRNGNAFAGWNGVRLRYCTSDGWLGANTKPQTLEGRLGRMTFPFQGARVVDAMLARLDEGATSDDGTVKMPRLSQARKIVVVGESAGGIGAMHHVDQIAERYRDAQTWGVLDGATEPDPAVLSDRERAAVSGARGDFEKDVVRGLWEGRTDDTCRSKDCYSAASTIPTGALSTPVVVRQDELDPVHLKIVGMQGGDPESYPDSVRDTLRRFAEQRSDASFLGSRCATHVVTTASGYFDEQVRDEVTGASASLQDIVEDLVLRGEHHSFVADPDANASGCGESKGRRGR